VFTLFSASSLVFASGIEHLNNKNWQKVAEKAHGPAFSGCFSRFLIFWAKKEREPFSYIGSR
jgi:hypothetical protein